MTPLPGQGDDDGGDGGEDDGDGALPEYGDRAGGFAAGVGAAEGFGEEWVRGAALDACRTAAGATMWLRNQASRVSTEEGLDWDAERVANDGTPEAAENAIAF